jgi:hypothetical protein
MRRDEWQVRRKAKAMTRAEIVVAAAEARIAWLDTATVLRVTARHMRRLKEVYLAEGCEGRRTTGPNLSAVEL